jgi:hypothetical protein
MVTASEGQGPNCDALIVAPHRAASGDSLPAAAVRIAAMARGQRVGARSPPPGRPLAAQPPPNHPADEEHQRGRQVTSPTPIEEIGQVPEGQAHREEGQAGHQTTRIVTAPSKRCRSAPSVTRHRRVAVEARNEPPRR